MRIRILGLSLLLPVLVHAFPPGSPMSEFGPNQVSMGLYFDYSGQDLFEEGAPSLLNSTGLSLDYAPVPYVQFGIFGGAAEFDIGVPPSQAGDTTKHAFDSDYKFSGGGSMKLATPRFLQNTTRLVAFGSASYVDNKDKFGNERSALVYDGGASFQVMIWNSLNFVLGGEFYTMVGDQKDGNGNKDVLGTSAPQGFTDYLRGLVGIEYYFKGKNRPFISVAFRPTGNMAWDDNLGIRNASISVTLGAMTTLGGKGSIEAGEEDKGLIDTN